MSVRSDIDAIRREQASLARSGRLHRVHWIIVGLSICITFGAWWSARSFIETRNERRFLRYSSQVVELMTDRLKRYEDALLAGVAAIKSNDGVMSREQWRAFANELKLDSRYPGINGIGIILPVARADKARFEAGQRRSYPTFTVFPEHDGPEHLVISFIEPEQRNAPAVGLDIAFETQRRQGAERARELGQTQISGPIVLVQDQSKTPGFLFYTPFYAAVPSQATPPASTPPLAGYVYAPFIVDHLTRGVLASDRRDISLEISDAGESIYSEHDTGDARIDPKPLFSEVRDVEVYGRTWRFDIRANAAFRDKAGVHQPLWVLIGGLGIDGMLLMLFLLLSRSNRNALSFAERATRVLRDKAKALEISNAELETFAYVVSHDLKTPLRGIHDLTDFLQEDLQQLDQRPAVAVDINHHIHRIHTQLGRANDLISGILDYSSIGAHDNVAEPVRTDELVSDVAQRLGLDQSQLRLAGQWPELVTDRRRLSQVFERLMDNAIKFHPTPAAVIVELSVRRDGDYYRFSVVDNGIGIDERFHQRIFEAFKTLQCKDEIDGAGVGLSIVDKSVRALGGSIHVESMLGEGSAFVFTWPVELPTQPQSLDDSFPARAA